MSRFYFGDDSSSNSDNDSSDSLPYPEPLPRSDFLKPNFSAAAYLGSLQNRHQTLEDLRAELRTRSQQLNQQLLDLVNSNYQDFLGLGSSLKGGDEKVEEVRVGLLGFQKDIEGVRKYVQEKETHVEEALEERKKIRKDLQVGRALLEFHERLQELESRLLVDSEGKSQDESDSEESSEDEDNGTGLMSLSRLRRHVRQYLALKQISTRIGLDHPFLVAQEARMLKVRNTLLLDLSTALKQAKSNGKSASSRVMSVIAVYRDMDEAGEAVKLFQSLPKA